MSLSTGARWTWAREEVLSVLLSKKRTVVSRQGGSICGSLIEGRASIHDGVQGSSSNCPGVTPPYLWASPGAAGSPALGSSILTAFLGFGHPVGLCICLWNGLITRFLSSMHKEGLRLKEQGNLDVSPAGLAPVSDSLAVQANGSPSLRAGPGNVSCTQRGVGGSALSQNHSQ